MRITGRLRSKHEFKTHHNRIPFIIHKVPEQTYIIIAYVYTQVFVYNYVHISHIHMYYTHIYTYICIPHIHR